jgi:hypothetical protein
LAKRQQAAKQGRKKLNHAVTAINTMSLLAGKLTEEGKAAKNLPTRYESEFNGETDQPEARNEKDSPDLTESDDEGIRCIACDMANQVPRLLSFFLSQ